MCSDKTCREQEAAAEAHRKQEAAAERRRKAEEAERAELARWAVKCQLTNALCFRRHASSVIAGQDKPMANTWQDPGRMVVYRCLVLTL